MQPSTVSLTLTLAFRNLMRNPRRSLIMLFAVTTGVWSMISLSALGRGLSEQMVRDAIHNLTGHVQLHSSKYLSDPVIEHRIPYPEGRLLDELQSPEVRKWGCADSGSGSDYE